MFKHEALIVSDNHRLSMSAVRDPCVAGSPSGLRYYGKRADSKWQPDSRRKKKDSIFSDFEKRMNVNVIQYMYVLLTSITCNMAENSSVYYTQASLTDVRKSGRGTPFFKNQKPVHLITFDGRRGVRRNF